MKTAKVDSWSGEPSGPWAGILTPSGRGAIGVVRVWGPGAVEVVDRRFRPSVGRTFSQGAVGRPRFGRFGTGAGDEVVAVVLPGEPPEVEIQCHGGPLVLEMVLGCLIEEGARRQDPRDRLREMSATTIQAEALADLSHAVTLRTAGILLDQSRGAWEAAVARLLDELGGRNQEGPAIELRRWLARAEVGLRLLTGWRVVLAGRPNVGKSRLFNALAGFDRSIVAPIPGTTRDVVSVPLAFDGWPVELCDTAGLRTADDPTEASGVARARRLQAQSDLTLLILDRSQPWGPDDDALIRESPNALVVLNKCDLDPASDPPPVAGLTVSAETGQGIEDLARAIVGRLLNAPPAPGEVVPFRNRHVRLIRNALDALERSDRPRVVQCLSEILHGADD